MNKILNRQLFRTKSYKPRAHGTGITELVVDNKPVQFFQAGTGPMGVVEPPPVEPVVDETAPTVAPTVPPTVAPAVAPTAAPPQGVAALGQQYAEMFQKMFPARSSEQILAERQRLLGDNKENLQLQAALALMGLGGRIASTPGSLATAVGRSLPEFSSDMMKVAAEQNKQQQALKLAALDAADRERQMKGQLGIQGLQTAITQSFSAGEADKAREFQRQQAEVARAASAKEAALQREFQGQQNTLSREAQVMLQDRAQAFQRGERLDTQDFSLLVRDPKTFVTLDPNAPNGYTLNSYKLNKEGKYVDERGNEKPASALEFTAQVAKIITPEFGEPKTAYIPDETQLTGMRPVTVQTDKRTDKLVQLNADGTRTPLKEGFILRGQTEFVDRKDMGGGFYSLSIKEGPFKDTTIIVDPAGRIQNAEDLRAKGIDPSKIKGSGVAPTEPGAAPGAAPQQRGAVQPQQNIQVAEVLPAPTVQERDAAIEAAATKRGNRPPAIGEVTGQGAQRYLVEAQPPSSTAPYDLPAKERDAMRVRAIQAERTLRGIENATKGAYEAVGLGPKLKSIGTEVFDPLIPGVDLAFTRNEANKIELRKLQKDIIGTFAQNTDRVSVYEQQLLKELGPDPEAWLANPKTALEKLRELHRLVANDLEANRATLEGRAPLVIKRLPTGTDNDPFTSDYAPYIQYMVKSGRGDFLAGKKFAPSGVTDPSKFAIIGAQ